MDKSIRIRNAMREDLSALLALLDDDPIARARPRLPDRTEAALDAIIASPENDILVGEAAGRVIACAQITVTPHLTYHGGSRATVEGVRVASDWRGKGVGERLLHALIEYARARGCHLVQLTTDKRRPRSIGFYEGLGFVASHEGMKLHLAPGEADQEGDADASPN